MEKSIQINTIYSSNGVRVGKSIVNGKGVFATRIFQTGETVIVGKIEKFMVENSPYATQIGIDRYVLYASPVPMLNHSCNPNCIIVVNKTGVHDFVAVKTISPSEEITFDYATTNYSVDHFTEPCSCGSKKCRGYVYGWKDLSPEEKKADQRFVSPYLLELDRGALCPK